MEKNPDSIRSFFFTLALLYGALAFTLLSFGVGVWVVIDPAQTDQSMASTGRYIVLMVMAATTTAGFLVFGRVTGRLALSTPLDNKFQTYRTAIIARCALFEMGGWVAAVMALLSNDRSLLLLTGVAAVLLLLYRPSRLSFLNTVPLQNEEQLLFRA